MYALDDRAESVPDIWHALADPTRRTLIEIAAVNPATALAATKTTTGSPLSTSPRQPPIDSTSSGFGLDPSGACSPVGSDPVTRPPASARTRG